MAAEHDLQHYVRDGEIYSPHDVVRVVRCSQLTFEIINVAEVPGGSTVAQILNECGAVSTISYIVLLEGHLIEAKNFCRVRVKGGVTLRFFPRLHGGGGNAWEIALQAVIAITALVLAAPTGGLSLVPGLTSLGLNAGIAQALVAGGVCCAGLCQNDALSKMNRGTAESNS
jgi:hypothetical protein